MIEYVQLFSGHWKLVWRRCCSFVAWLRLTWRLWQTSLCPGNGIMS